jgi:hypothetical protein
MRCVVAEESDATRLSKLNGRDCMHTKSKQEQTVREEKAEKKKEGQQRQMKHWFELRQTVRGAIVKKAQRARRERKRERGREGAEERK